MSKTAREVIAGYKFVRSHSGWDDYVDGDFELLDADADKIIAALADAGFVIVPKEPTQVMLVNTDLSKAGSHAWELELDQLATIYRAMIAAASQDK